MTFTFRPAVRESTSVLIGLAGPSGSGKTFSALRMAAGMGGPIFMIDTESGRGLHYADQFDFQYAKLDPPFRPAAYLEAISAAKDAGANVIIVDSQSHEHEGPGGILEMHDQELDRMAGTDYQKRERMKFAAWITPKKEHNKFVNGILQLNVNIIFCFRAKKKLVMVKNDKGRQEPVDIGWQPICSDRFEFEMATLLMLPPNSGGVPDLAHESTKLQEQHKPFFPAGAQIDESMGKSLAGWASGGKAPDGAPKEKPAQIDAHEPSEGDDKPPIEARRASAMAYLTGYTSEGAILGYLGVESRSDINQHHLEILRDCAKRLKAGDDAGVVFAVADTDWLKDAGL